MFYLVYVYVPPVEPTLAARTGVPDGCRQPCEHWEHNWARTLGEQRVISAQNHLLLWSYSPLIPSSSDLAPQRPHPTDSIPSPTVFTTSQTSVLLIPSPKWSISRTMQKSKPPTFCLEDKNEF